MMTAAARRIEPARPRRRRWPVLAAGVMVVAGGSAVAVMLRKRRRPVSVTDPGWPGGQSRPPATDRNRAAPEAAPVDVNGQLRTP